MKQVGIRGASEVEASDINFKYIIINSANRQRINDLSLEDMQQEHVNLTDDPVATNPEPASVWQRIIGLISDELSDGNDDICLFCLCRMDVDNTWQGLSIMISSDQWQIFHDKDTERTKKFRLGINVSKAIKKKFEDKIPKHIDGKDKGKINLSKDSSKENLEHTESKALLNMKALFNGSVDLSSEFTVNDKLQEVISKIKKRVLEDGQYVPDAAGIQNLVQTLSSKDFAIEQKVDLIKLLILFQKRDASLIDKDKIIQNIKCYFVKLKEKVDFDSAQAIIKFLSESEIDKFLPSDEFIKELQAALKKFAEKNVDAESTLVNSRSRINIESNAYNQRYGYWYGSEDIDRIGNQWFREYRESIDIRENMNLDQLARFCLEYKKSVHTKATLIPLNVGGNHWISIAIVPSSEGGSIVLHKDSLGDKDHERDVKILFEEKLGNISFRVNEELDDKNQQKDGSSCGSFTLANLKVMAEKISSPNCDDFLSGFAEAKGIFKTQEDINKFRDEDFPKLYAEYTMREKSMKKIKEHHIDELRRVQGFLNQKIQTVLAERGVDKEIAIYLAGHDEKPDSDLRIGLEIVTSEEEIDMSDNKYEYKYSISTGKGMEGPYLECINRILQLPQEDCFKSPEESRRISVDYAESIGMISNRIPQLNLRTVQHGLMSHEDIISLGKDIQKLEKKFNGIVEKSTSKVIIQADWLKKLIKKMSISLVTQDPISDQSVDSLLKIIQLAVRCNDLELNRCILSFLSQEDLDLNFCKRDKNIWLEHILTFFNNVIPQMLSGIIAEDDTGLILTLAKKIEKVEYIEKLDATNLGKYISEILIQGLSEGLSSEIIDLKLLESKLIKRFSPEVQGNLNLILGLEKAFIANDIKSIVDQCSRLAKAGKTFPAKYWDKLGEQFDDRKVKEIISSLFEDENVQVREEIKKKFLGYLSLKEKFLEDVKDDKSVVKTLLRVKALRINELNAEFIKEALSNKDNRESVLEVIELAIIGADENRKELGFRELLVEVQKIAIEEPHAAWIMGLVDKNSPFSKIRDSKLDLVTRQEALNQLLDQITIDAEKINFLVQLLQKDNELGVKSFEKLVNLSINDLSLLQGVDVDLALLLFKWSIDYASLMVDDNEVLSKDFNGFLNNLTKYLIAKNADVETIVEGLMRISFSATNDEIRQNAIELIESEWKRDIIEKYIDSDTFDKLKHLSTLIIDPRALKLPCIFGQSNAVIIEPNPIQLLKELSSIGALITQDQIQSLFNLINDDDHKEYHQEIVGILLEVGENQTVNYLPIRDKLEKLLSEGLNDELLQTISIIASSDQEFRLKEQTILMLAKFLEESSNALDMRIEAAIILDMQIKRMHDDFFTEVNTTAIFSAIKNIVFEEKTEEEKDDHSLLVGIVFQTSDSLASHQQNRDSQFINDYYSWAKELFKINEKAQEVQWLVNYIGNSGVSNKNKYLLLRALNQSVLVIGIDRTIGLIIKHKHEQAFCLKDILSKILLECIDAKFDHEAEKCKSYISRFEEVVGESEISQVEDRLFDLIRNQDPILELTKLYLRKKLNGYVYRTHQEDDLREIAGLEDQLANSIADYSIETIDQLFSKLNLEVIKNLKTKKELITDLIKFLRVMASYRFSYEEMEQFFSEELPENSAVADWSIKFHEIVAAKLIATKIPGIVGVNSALKECSNSILYYSICQRSSSDAQSLPDEKKLEWIKQSKWGKNLYSKLARVLRADEMQGNLSFDLLKSTSRLLDKVDNDDKLKDLAQALDIIYDYDLKADDVDARTGKSLVSILSKSGNWAVMIHQLAINKNFVAASQSLKLDELRSEILTLNPEFDQEDLKSLLAEYDQVAEAEKGGSLFYQLLLIQLETAISELTLKNIKEQCKNILEIIKRFPKNSGVNDLEAKIKELCKSYESASDDADSSKEALQNQFVLMQKEISDVVKQLKEGSGSKAIEKWGVEEIKGWSQDIMSNPFGNSEEQKKQLLYEKLAVAKRAVQVFHNEKITPRDIQMLSLLLLLNNEPGRGRLAQIKTGEGKTTIVAMLAAIKALEGVEDPAFPGKRINQVDIITSSSELAKPQSEEQEKYFALFGLTVSHNSSGTDEEKKKAYKDNIVYGAASDFQGDILRDEYNKLGTRNGRKCNIAIVDEVDSMLIDGKNHIVMLSNPMPAMDYLEPVLATIWNQLLIISQHIVEDEDGNIVYREQKYGIDVDGEERSLYTDQELEFKIGEKQTKVKMLKKLAESYVRKLLRGEILESGEYEYQELLDLKPEEIKIMQSQDRALDSYEAELKEGGSNSQNPPLSHPKIIIPKHLRSLVLTIQLPKWIDSAISAMFRYEIDKHYILKDERFIAPVDASNTGIVQGNMIWSDGLHQFLQLKHGCKITSESLTTNLISNVAFFKRYRDKIFGLTGTLGTLKARELLHKHYKLDSVIIPPFRSRRYKELQSIISSSENGWYRNIAESCLSKVEHGRGVLVITKYINEVDRLKEILETEYLYPSDKIKVYETEKDAAVAKQELKDGEIILATNIAGRGTDIKPSTIIEENGGLHVCVTFLPTNQRIEEQNIGRTSRTGNKGSAQFVLLNKNNHLDVLRIKRNEKEREDLTRADSEIRKVLIKDEWFSKFCDLLGTIDESSKTKDKSNYIKAAEERFAIWLKERDQELDEIEKLCQSIKEDDDGVKSQELIEAFTRKKFELFEGEITKDKSGDKSNLVKNPIFWVLEGNKLLNEGLENGGINAIACYTKAIDLDPHFAVNAYYNRACARIRAYGESKHYKVEGRQAISDLQEAKRIIEENLKPLLTIIQKSTNSEIVSEQLQHKLTLYNTQIQAIDSAVGKGYGYATKQLETLSKQEEDGIVEQSKIDNIEAFLEHHKYKIITISDKTCLDAISSDLRRIKSSLKLHQREEELFDELLSNIEKKRAITLEFIQKPLATLAKGGLFTTLLYIQETKLGSLPKNSTSKKIREDREKLGASIQEIQKDIELSGNKNLKEIIKRLTRYRNILETAVNPDVVSIKALDTIIVKLSGVSTYSDKLKMLEESKKSLSVDKDYKTRTIEELSKKGTARSKDNIEELRPVIDKITRQIAEIDKSIGIIQSQVSEAKDGWLITIDLEVSMLETYKKDLRGISKSDREAISDQKNGFYKKDKEGKSTGKKDTDRIEKIEKGIIGVSLSKSHKMKIDFKPMKESLSGEENPKLFDDEIREYENNGCIGSFEVEDIKPIPWWSVIGVFLIGLVQLVAGAVLSVCTLGIMASVGAGLMSEGVSDMITAVKDGIINRNFDWASWGIQKAISLAVSLICAGLSALKTAVMAAYKTGEAAVKAGVEVAKQVVQSTWKLVAKSAAIALAKGVAKECVTQLVDYGVSQAVMPNIEAEVRKIFEPEITKTLTESYSVKMMFELDAKNRNKRYENLLQQKVMALLSPESGSQSDFGTALKSVLHQVSLSQVPGLSAAKKAYDALAAISELTTILPKFIEDLKNVIDEISQIAEEEKSKTEISEEKRQSQNTSATSDNSDGSTSTYNMSSPSHEDDKSDIDLKAAKTAHKQAKPRPVEVRSTSEIASAMSVTLSNKATAIIASKLIKPVTDGLVQSGIDNAFAGAEKELEDAIKARHEHKAKLEMEAAAEEAKKKVEEDKKRKAEERFNKDKTKAEEKLKSGKQEFSPRDEDDIKGYAEREKKHIVIKDKDGKTIAEFGKEYASSNGKEPVTLIKSADDRNGIGHYEAPGAAATTTDKYSCVADAIAAQTGQTPQQVEAKMHANEGYVERTNFSFEDLGNIDAWQNLQRERGLGGAAKRTIIKDTNEKVQLRRIQQHVKKRIEHTEEIANDIQSFRNDYPGVEIEVTSAAFQQGRGRKGKNPIGYDKSNQVFQCEGDYSYDAAHTVGASFKITQGSMTDAKYKEACEKLHDINMKTARTQPLRSEPNRQGGERVFDKVQIDYYKKITRGDVAHGSIGQFEKDLEKSMHEHSKRRIIGNYIERADNKSYLLGLKKTIKKPHKGTNPSNLTTIERISAPFYEYTMEGISDILGLRLRAEVTNTGLINTIVLPGIYVFSKKYSNIHTLLFYLNLYFINIMLNRNKQAMNRASQPVILAPISLHGKHAVGMMFVAQEDGSGYKAFYLDPENTTIPEDLATIFKDNGYEIEQLPTEGQRYTNCGPEVIENMMLYLTGERLSQEDAIVNNSKLVEQQLLSSHVVEEVNCLSPQDTCSRKEMDSVMSNVLNDSKVSSNGYIIDNPTRYDIVVPQGTIDMKMVNLEMLMEPKDLLLEVLSDHNSVIDQDYAERIMGDVYLTD